MELDPKAFFQKYGLSEKSRESDLKDYFERLNSDSPVKMISLSKNLIALRILQTAQSLNALKKSPENSTERISDIFNDRQIQHVINKFSIDSDAYVPSVVMKGGALFTILISAIVWALILTFLTIKFFWQHLEILLATLFSDVVIIAVPLLILAYFIPLALFYIIFPSAFASKEIDGVVSIRDLVFKIYVLNPQLYIENNFHNSVQDISTIRNSWIGENPLGAGDSD